MNLLVVIDFKFQQQDFADEIPSFLKIGLVTYDTERHRKSEKQYLIFLRL